MSASSGLIYEVTLTIERDIAEPFDQWLAEHVENMLDLPGFVSARVFEMDDDDDGYARRVTHYYLESENHLEQYFADNASDMRQSGIDRFGDRFRASRRILRQTEVVAGQIGHIENCLNCGMALGGQYCGNCGQRSRSRLISLWELVSDAFGDLFELDSRIWRTVVPLLVRPGKLTYDYLQGRRARFMPPFRTYLVLSILFFLVLLFDPKEDFGIFFDPEPDTPEEALESNATVEELRNEVLTELAKEGIIVSPDEADQAAGTTDSEPGEEEEDGDGLRITVDGEDNDCTMDESARENLPDWLSNRLSPERLEAVCEKVGADNGKALLAKLADNVPAALFFLLPLMAFVLKLLYPLSKRFYVEHLLFVVHYHAFFFLILILQMLYVGFGHWLRFPNWMVVVPLFATSLYIPVYLYKAMRRVYGQRHLATVPKFIGMVIAYWSGLLLIFGVTAVLAAFSL
jgi:hypothetical protein